jgi:CHAT domain-containing protein
VLLSRYNAAELARVTGDVEFAATDLRVVVESLRSDAGGDAGWLLVTAMKNLARAVQAIGRSDEAERWSAEALRLPGLDPNQRVDLLIVLASARRHQDRPIEVEADLERAVADLGDVAGEDSSAYLAALGCLAGFLPPSDTKRIEEYYQRVVTGLGDRHPDIRGPTLVNLAGVRWMAGDHDGAFEAFRGARPLWEEAVAERWRVRSVFETDLDEPWPFRDGALQLVARHRADDPESVAFAFRVGVASKRLQAEALVRQQDLVLEGRDDLVELHDLAARLRRAAAWEDASEQELDEVEAMLAFQVPRAVLLRSFEESEPATVADALPLGTVLVEYVRCAAVDAEGASPLSGRPSYLSFVLPAGQAGGLRLFDLGDAETIDELARELAASIRGAGRDLGPALDDGVQTDWRVPARALAALIIDPLAGALPELATVLLAPAGPLCAVPFDALLDRSGRPVLLTRTVGILGSARDAHRVTHRPNWATEEPLVISAPQYGPPAAPFRPLPGAGSEGRTVARLLKVRAVTGKDATRDVVLSARNPEILHLATHGFYLAQQADPDDAARFSLLASHPLLCSGVALAGANRSVFGSGAEPSTGVVTALDALGLQLYGTDLVVLSACETGMGPVDPAEGTLGLARSFLLGGARSVVWSLWKVDDASTASLMKAFYRRLMKEMPRAEALRRSKRDLYHAFPDRPDLWAAFALQGDPDPLMRFRFLLVPDQQIPNNAVEADGTTFVFDTGGRPFATFEAAVGGEPLTIGSASGRNLSLAFAEDKRAAAVAAFRAGNAEDAERLMTEALDGLKTAKVGRPLAANIKAALVVITAAQGKYEQARRYGGQAVREHERLELPEQELAAVLDNLAVAEANLGEIDRAVTHASRALRLKEDLYPDGHRQRAFTVDLLRQLGEGART